MIKDEELRDKIYSEFPSIPPKAIDEIERECLPQFLFYTKAKNGKSASVYCTSCRRSDVYHKSITVDGMEIEQSNVPNMLRHGETIRCPICGHAVECKSEGRGHKNLQARGNYCVFIAKDNNLYIHAIKYVISWRNIDDPQTEIYWFKKYAFAPQGAQCWKYKWDCIDMVPMKTISEPQFALDGGWWMTYNDKRAEDRYLYTCINEDALDNTFLRYQEFYRLAHNTNCPMSYLEHMAKYPDITEKLTKAGFEEIINDVCRSNHYGFKKLVKWKKHTIKDALGLNSQEIKYWRQILNSSSIEAFSQYLKCKKIVSDPRKLSELFKAYDDRDAYRLCLISDLSGAKINKVCNHINKVSNKSDRKGKIAEWLDTLQMMEKLGYSKGNSLAFSKDLPGLHRRMIQETNARTKEFEKAKYVELDRKIERQKKELSKLIYSNFLYTIVLPESIADIHQEGRILDHCVASYAERHAKGELHILFARKQWDIESPWYTIEVDKQGRIVQWFGYQNNRKIPKHPDMKQFISEYEIFLDMQYGRITQEEYETKLIKLSMNGGYTNGFDESKINVG